VLEKFGTEYLSGVSTLKEGTEYRTLKEGTEYLSGVHCGYCHIRMAVSTVHTRQVLSPFFNASSM